MSTMQGVLYSQDSSSSEQIQIGDLPEVSHLVAATRRPL